MTQPDGKKKPQKRTNGWRGERVASWRPGDLPAPRTYPASRGVVLYGVSVPRPVIQSIHGPGEGGDGARRKQCWGSAGYRVRAGGLQTASGWEGFTVEVRVGGKGERGEMRDRARWQGGEERIDPVHCTRTGYSVLFCARRKQAAAVRCSLVRWDAVRTNRRPSLSVRTQCAAEPC